MEDFDDYIFLILKMLYFEEDENAVKAEQVGLIIGSNFVISSEETLSHPRTTRFHNIVPDSHRTEILPLRHIPDCQRSDLRSPEQRRLEPH